MAAKDKARASSGGRISPKQKQFIQEYLVDLNATQAAIRAGYSERSARQHADAMLSRSHIAAAVAQAQQKRSERTEITQDMVLRELAKIGFSDIRKVVRWGNTTVRTEVDDDGNETEVPYHGLALVDSTEIDDDTAAAIAKVAEGKFGLQVDLYDKLHSHFAAGRLNKINGRKEFFRADLKAIEAVIRANYDAVVEVVHTAPAEQYRESLRLTMPLESRESFAQIELATAVDDD